MATAIKRGQSCAAQVEAFATKAKRMLAEVAQESSIGVAEAATLPKDQGGHLPVVKGNLRRSFAASTVGPVSVLWGQREFHGTLDGVMSVIRNAKIGQTIWMGFQAAYARKAEVDNGFVRLTTQRWQQIVADAVRLVRARNGE